MKHTILCGLSLLAALSLSSAVHAAVGPNQVASITTPWTEAVNTPAKFDQASRAALLVYAQTLQAMQALSSAEMRQRFSIKSVNRTSVDRWLKQEQQATQNNYQLAAQACTPNDWTCLNPKSSDSFATQAWAWQYTLPLAMRSWHQQLSQFCQTYVSEQLRLAALFPAVSSEIGRFNENEWQGDSLPDRQFFLTFDDGPSAGGGNTDDTIAMLDRHQKTASFFLLGQALQTRFDHATTSSLNNLYHHHCVASHGWEHQSHAKWSQWQRSVQRTQDLIGSIFNRANILPLFRPPYGQRQADSGDFFHQQGLRVALWNIDSQDWNSQVNADDVLQRMKTLMLIKRHGVLLFHDVHNKAQSALPRLFDELGTAVEWADCQRLRGL